MGEGEKVVSSSVSFKRLESLSSKQRMIDGVVILLFRSLFLSSFHGDR